MAGPSRCPPLGVIPTWVKDVESYGVGSLTLFLLVIPKYFIMAVCACYTKTQILLLVNSPADIG